MNWYRAALSWRPDTAHAWYRQKLAADWRRHTADEAEAIFTELGLDPEFWRLH